MKIGQILTGLMGLEANSLGMQGSMISEIQHNIGSVFGRLDNLGHLGGLENKHDVSDLLNQTTNNMKTFANIFASVSSAGAIGGNIQALLKSSSSHVFGNAATLVGDLDSLPGFDIGLMTNKMFQDRMSVEDFKNSQDLDMLAGGFLKGQFKQALDRTLDLTGDFGEVLPELISRDKINAFSSLYGDYNSYATNGFGNLTNDLRSLAVDLTNLGHLGDLTDLMNIGTPNQVARQLITAGLGMTTGLLSLMLDQGVTPDMLGDDTVNPVIYDILGSINNEEVIARVKETMLISDYINITTLADLVDHKILFPFSYDFNKFSEIRDMALTLSLIGIGNSRAVTFEDLGQIMLSLETVEDATELLEEKNVIRPEEFTDLQFQLPPASYFNTLGITVADFIGTAAGYVHTNTLPRIKELYDTLENDYDIVDDFKLLMVLLTDTLKGDYLVLGAPNSIVVPTTAGYIFGTYYSLDEAALAIKDAIEAEIVLIEEVVAADPDLTDLFNELSDLWTRSHDFLVHEKRMRQAYGFDFGDPRKTEYFSGDGSTLSFPLSTASTGNMVVHVNGTLKYKNSYTYDDTTKSLVLNSAPASLAIVSVEYDTGLFKPTGTVSDVWSFATSMEQHATNTGYGMPADILNRILTNDIHGQRIRALMVQSRNNLKLANKGVPPLGLSQVTDEAPDVEFNFTDHTGVWSTDASRAAEIWVQNKADVDTFEQYIVQSYAKNKNVMQQDIDILLQNIVRQLIFFTDGNLAVSELMINLYQTNQNNEIYAADRSDLVVPYSNELPSDGYVLGPYREILSTIAREEGLTNNVFNDKLSAETEKYLKEFNFSIKLLVTIVQRVLMVNVSQHLGLAEGDAQAIFGTQSAFKTLLQNISNNY